MQPIGNRNRSCRQFLYGLNSSGTRKLLVFSNLKAMAERGGFEPPVQLLTVQRFSKLTPSRPVAWIQSVSASISAVVRVKSAHLVIFMHLYMHLSYDGR